MSSEVLTFTGKTRSNHREVYFCRNCASRNFRFVKTGASEELEVECSNCENVQTWCDAKDIQQ